MAVLINDERGEIVAGSDGDASVGNLILRASDGTDRVRISAGPGDIHLGGNGVAGDFYVFDASGDNYAVHEATIRMHGSNGDMIAGGGGSDGSDGSNGTVGNLILRASDGTDRVRISAGPGDIHLGGNGVAGDFYVFDASGDNYTMHEATIHLDGRYGRIVAGGSGDADGDLILRATDGTDRISLSAGSGNINLGGNGVRGDFYVFDAFGDNKTEDQARIRMHGGDGSVVLDGTGIEPGHVGSPRGAVVVYDNLGKRVFHFMVNPNILTLGSEYTGQGLGAACNLSIRNSNGNQAFYFNGDFATLELGTLQYDGNGVGGSLIIYDQYGTERISLDGNTGECNCYAADTAEDFTLAGGLTADPGNVLVIADDDSLAPCSQAYDRKVAGVVSGAGGLTPAIVLNRRPAESGRVPVSLNGKVYCNVDARYAAVEVGDLLTTSPTPGHAMRADDPQRAFGAVIGKALRPLKDGVGMIPILVSLQ